LNKPAVDSQTVASTIQRWLDTFIVGMNLCPFAAPEIARARVRTIVCEARDEDALLAVLQEEVLALAEQDATETTLLVHPHVLCDFLDYNDFLGVCDQLLVDMNAEGEFQIASFHPQYQFAGTQPNDAENFANKSPYPLLHILRESSVTRAVDAHPDIDAIPDRNIQKLNELGASQLQSLWLGLTDA